MRFEVRIDCNNAAFGDDPRLEVMRLLEELTSKVGRHNGYDKWQSLMDGNGNVVGYWRFGDRT